MLNYFWLQGLSGKGMECEARHNQFDASVSIVTLIMVFVLCSGVLIPSLVNSTLIQGNSLKSGRYAVTHPALESIASEESDAVVVIGSSVLQYAMDGQCIGEQLDNDNMRVYNLAIGGANPYTEMIQIPTLINAKPKAVIIDLGPNALWDFDTVTSLDEYIQFRFTILSLTLPLGEEQGWSELIRDRDKTYIASSLEERIQLTASYSQVALEDVLVAEFHDELGVRYNEREMPGVDEEGWLDYLQTPNFLPPLFELKNQSEVDAWFEENMPKRVRYGVYNPLHNETLNHAALDYTVRSLTKAGIEVFMLAVPHHPLVYDYLQTGQIDGHNSTLSHLEEEYGAITVNWFWESWEQGMFRDRNHLGDEGRVYACERIAEMLNEHMG